MRGELVDRKREAADSTRSRGGRGRHESDVRLESRRHDLYVSDGGQPMRMVDWQENDCKSQMANCTGR